MDTDAECRLLIDEANLDTNPRIHLHNLMLRIRELLEVSLRDFPSFSLSSLSNSSHLSQTNKVLF